MRGVLVAAGCAFGMTATFAPSSSHAQSAGCSLAGGSVSIVGGGLQQDFGAGEFEAGEILRFRFTINTVATPAITVDAFAVGPSNASAQLPNAVGSFVGEFTIPANGNYTVSANYAVGGAAGDTATVTFLGCGSSAASIQIDAINTARAAFKTQTDFVFRRTNSLVSNAPSNRASSSAQVAFRDGGNAFYLDGEGAAGQGADAPFGVWADAGWSGFDNKDANLGSDGGAVSLGAGIDTPIRDDLLVGGAITFNYSYSKRDATDDESDELALGFAPYIAYQIDDVFAVQGVAGYNRGQREAEIGGVKGSAKTQRYFAAFEASAFQTYGAFSAFASVGVLWAKPFKALMLTNRALRSTA